MRHLVCVYLQKKTPSLICHRNRWCMAAGARWNTACRIGVCHEQTRSTCVPVCASICTCILNYICVCICVLVYVCLYGPVRVCMKTQYTWYLWTKWKQQIHKLIIVVFTTFAMWHSDFDPLRSHIQNIENKRCWQCNDWSWDVGAPCGWCALRTGTSCVDSHRTMFFCPSPTSKPVQHLL